MRCRLLPLICLVKKSVKSPGGRAATLFLRTLGLHGSEARVIEDVQHVGRVCRCQRTMTRFGDQALQLRHLVAQLLQLPDLARLEPAVDLFPAVERLLRDADLAAQLADGDPCSAWCRTAAICSVEKRFFFTASPWARWAGLCRNTHSAIGPKRPGAPHPCLPLPTSCSRTRSAFMVQKLLVHESRRPDKRAQDLLYIHDALELFGGALEELRAVWRDQVRPSMPDRTARRANARARALFETVTDRIREAARIPETRRLSPEQLRAASEYGLEQILGG